MTLDYVLEEENKEKVVITPGTTVIIKTKEKIKIPNDCMGIIAEKNSIMRMGLFVRGPYYQPGHETYCFLMVQNISSNEIILPKNLKIAQIMFDKLNDIPDVPYNKNSKSSYNDETKYRGFGKYEKEYNQYIKRITSLTENLDKKEGTIYANILTLMGIFVTIFTLINFNFEKLKSFPINTKDMMITNLYLVTILFVFIMLISFVVNNNKTNHEKHNLKLVSLILIGLCVLIFIFL